MDERSTRANLSTTGSTSGPDRDGKQAVEGTLILLRELMDSVKETIELDCLEAAISSLQDALHSRTHVGEGRRLIIYRQLIRALLVRYGLNGWMEDLETCVRLLLIEVGDKGFFQARSDQGAAEGQVAGQLIQACQNSIDIATLETIICIATEAISSHSDDKLNPLVAELWITLGKALIIKQLKHGEMTEIERATKAFQQAKLVCLGDTSLTQLCLISLSHIEWLRLIEFKDLARFRLFWDYWSQADEHNSEGKKLNELGTQMVKNAVNGTQLQEGIGLLTASLNCRQGPHPQRSHSLTSLADAFYIIFERQGDLRDLEACIEFNREALCLRQSHHPDRSTSLMKLAAALASRSRHNKAIGDLEEAIMLHREVLGLVSLQDPIYPEALYNLATALCARFQEIGTFHDLEESITLFREALDMRPKPHPRRFELLGNLAASLFLRFEHKGALADLEESITLDREALVLRPPSHPDYPEQLDNLASALFIRFTQEGALNDLEECIALRRQALEKRLPHHSDSSRTLNGLASALLIRFKKTSIADDLEECILIYQEALTKRPPHHPDRYESLNNLATSLSTRFEQKGAIPDLEECILLHREALSLLPLPHPRRSASLYNLATAIFFRFCHKGVVHDLEECIILHREGLDSVPLPHPSRSGSLNNLANALSTRFQHGNALNDLEECIKLHREAINLRSPTHPEQSASLSNLAAALLNRFVCQGILGDLEECIVLLREALDIDPPHHPNHAKALNCLGNALSTRFQHNDAFSDLEECITLHRKALDLSPPPRPDRSKVLYDLSRALLTYSEQKESHEDVQDALGYLEEGAEYPTGSLINRLRMSKYWATCAWKHCPGVTLDAYHCALRLLPQLASLDLTVKQRQDVLQHNTDLVEDAAKCAIDAKQCEVAVTFLSTGRSIFWSQALQLRTPVDQLLATHSAIAEKFISISEQLENASYSELGSISNLAKPEDLELHAGTRVYMSLNALADQRQQIIEDIRKIPGYEGFLLPPPFSLLQSAASNGPIVFLNASTVGCDVIVLHGTRPLVHIPLTDMHLKELQTLKELVHMLSSAGMRSIKIPQDTVDTLQTLLGRDLVSKGISESDSNLDSNDDAFRSALELLWVKIVEPVVKALGFKKTNLPGRIWWIPTGPFASLPIHAAGIYSANNEPIDCLSQYVVSSYCTAPQDLLHATPQIAESFRMTAVIEPEAPNAAPLPATRTELRQISKHVPDQHLITHEGSKNQPTNVDELVSNIQQSSIVHFGCHGMQNITDPLESYLLLSGGKLTMSKIIKECRVPEGALAYLSACETAKGDKARPGESLNLVATMMFAGFRGVVGTLWSIMDEDAPIVADVFYRHLFRNGKETPPDVRDAAYGLHLATKELRDRGNPFYSWVPYVHYGI